MSGWFALWHREGQGLETLRILLNPLIDLRVNVCVRLVLDGSSIFSLHRISLGWRIIFPSCFSLEQKFR